MNRTILAVVGAFSASSLLIADSAVKGTALLALAAVAAMILRRDSAATRHLVWLLAMVAMLAVPALSALLPQWRVLPEWAALPQQVAAPAEKSLPPNARPAPIDSDEPHAAAPAKDGRPSAAEYRPVANTPESRPDMAMPGIGPESPHWGGNWIDALPLAWAIGFFVLMLRLAASRWLLGRSERRATVLCFSTQSASHDPLVKEMEAAREQLDIGRPVTLLIHPDKTIPVVWGILRSRLLLPAEARDWSREQLRSVLLHELAHVKRHDALVQLMTQIACALHWFNPLVWYAARGLGVERERACDDLVLASGVRPSVYAGHLLEVVTGLAPVRGTQACGLAMARKSSLEGRLIAVLSQNLNRRRVSMALATLALVVAAGVAVPIAMLRATDEPPTPMAPAGKSADETKPARTAMKPKHEYAQSLFAKWKAYARTDGKIPGALIGQVAREIDGFLKQYPQDENTPKLAAIRPRLDATHDWTQADVVALLDEITAISTAPVSWADIPMQFDDMRNIQPGKPLPEDLKSAAWGAPAANGLCAAWLLEPRADKHALGSVLKSRVLYCNTGKQPIVFVTEGWHQDDSHTARDAQGAKLTVTSTHYRGITPTAKFRLAPGEYCEVLGHGIAVGAGAYEEEHSLGSVGAVIEAKVGDDVRVSHLVSTTESTWTRPGDPKDPGELWKKGIAERVAREAPMPKVAADREQIVRRVTRDLFGEDPSAEEVAAFTADNAPDALEKLTTRLQAKPRVEPFSGALPTGETSFVVIPADPDAAKKPRAANSPGRYVLADRVHLLVSQTTTEGQRTNKAIIAFLSEDPKVASPHKPYEIALPDGLSSWGAVWQRSSGELWVMQKGLVRKYDFGDPDRVKEKRFEPGTIKDVPEPLREPLRRVFDVADAPKGAPEPQPKSKEAKALFDQWKSEARTNGDIPGGLVGRLADKVKEFVRNNSGDGGGGKYAKKMAPLVPRIDDSHDWKPADIVALLDDIAAAHKIPLETTRMDTWPRTFRTGEPLPKKLENAPWGEPDATGLRLAWLLEPRATEHPLDTSLKSTIFIRNSGKNTVVFRTQDWHQFADHKAHDAKGTEIKVDATEWTRLSHNVPFRLAPGEFVELPAAGIGIGANRRVEDWLDLRVGFWIDAKAGDEVTFIPAAVPARSARGWWLAFIAARLDRDRPLPSDAENRTRLLDRAVRELFGTPPTAEETAAFVADREPDALDSVAKRLARRRDFVPFSGSLSSAPTSFRVLPADPDAAKKPRVVTGPGHYTLGAAIGLQISRRSDGKRIVNEARIGFYSQDPKPAPRPHEIKLPDGHDSWAAAWLRNETVLWVMQDGSVRKYDFTNTAQVKEGAANRNDVPAPVLDALRAAFESPDAPKQTPPAPK